MKKQIIIILVTGLFLSFGVIATADEPIFGEIIFNPEVPTRLSEVIFSVNVTGDNIEEVLIIVEECAKDICYADLLNVSMVNIVGDIWEGEVTLTHDDITHCNSWLVIKSNGTWYDYKSDMSRYANFTVVQGEDGTPGFEFILLIFALVFLFYWRQNKKFL